MMKRIIWATVLLAIAFLTASCQSSPTPSRTSPTPTSGNAKFFCDEDGRGTPTTYGINNQGTKVPVIRWESQHFTDSGWTPRARCDRVSDKFVEAYQQGILNYITTGIENKLLVICVSS